MAIPFPSQIERRPMTSKQARRRWQINGCPTVSPAERRRLQREAELEQRAQKIRDDEKRKKVNTRKRKEKEEQVRETKKRMGFQDDVKLPEGQLGLGQFFTTRTTRSMKRTVTVQREESLDQPGDDDAPLVQDVCKNKSAFDHKSKHEEKGDLSEHKSYATIGYGSSLSRTANKEQQQNVNLSTIVPMVEERKHWFSTPRKSKRDKQLEDQSDIPNLAEQDSMACKPSTNPLPFIDTEMVSSSQPHPSQELTHRPILAPLDKNMERKREVEQVDLTFLAHQIMPEDRISNTRSTSLPSALLKRDLEQAGFGQFEFANDENTIIPRVLSNKRPRISSLSSITIKAISPGQLVTISRTPLAASCPVTLDRSSIRDEPILPNNMTNPRCAVFQPRSSIQTSVESFYEGLLDDDFNALDDAESSQLKEGISQTGNPSILPQGLSDEPERNFSNSKRALKSKKLSPLKAPSACTNSTESYTYDLSSQDYAELEEITKTPQKIMKSPALLPIAKIRSQASQTPTADSSHDDVFDFLPGCTQALAALVDSDVQSSQSSTSPKITGKVSTPTPRARTKMPPPPLPPLRPSISQGNSKRPSAQSDDSDDMFNCFAGSTQALLDL